MVERGNRVHYKALSLQQLEQCLSVNGGSENEEDICRFVIETLHPYVEFLTVYRTGNVLAQKTCGNGHGPVILLNAYLDTVDAIEEDREIVKNGSIWSSSKAILDVDDRTGVAVLWSLPAVSIQSVLTVKLNLSSQ